MLIIFLLVAVGIAAVIAIIIAMNRGAKRGDHNTSWPFYPKRVLTAPEQVLYHRLVAAMPECIVLAQVQLSQVLGIDAGSDIHAWRNRISQKSLDFVVCLKDSTVVAAIELDDSTHGREARKNADAVKDKALYAAGVPLIRWHVRDLPGSAAIRQALTT